MTDHALPGRVGAREVLEDGAVASGPDWCRRPRQSAMSTW